MRALLGHCENTMNDETRVSESEATLRALRSDYCPEPIAEARRLQDEILMKRFGSGTYRIADIGCGEGPTGSMFAPTCEVYHGFELSPMIAEVVRKRWRDEGLDNTSVFVGDVAQADLRPEYYDIAWCLYFTPGNMRDVFDDLAGYTDEYLDQNPHFIAVVSRFMAALKPGGRMFLTVYKDVPEAEAAQIDFYVHTNQTVASEAGSRFVATGEGFWSVRFTKASMLSNLTAAGVAETDVTFTDLNAIAWLVEINKLGA